jgi:hypothetical protein
MPLDNQKTTATKKEVRGSKITFDDIGAEFAKIPLSNLKETSDFVMEDHWGGGKYWIGWQPVSDEHGEISFVAMTQWTYVAKSFTQKNDIGANIKRLEGAVLGNEPDFDIVSSTYDDTLALDETKTELTTDDKFYRAIDDSLVYWWDQKNIHQLLKDFLRAKSAFGKAAILVYIPTGFLVEKEANQNGETKKVFGLETTAKFDEVLNRIHVEVLGYEDFIDVKDTEFGGKFTLIRLSKDSDGSDRFGVFYVGTDNRTYFRVVNQNTKEEESVISCDLSGNNLCIVVGEYDTALITKSVKSQQKSLNHALTGENYALANINYPVTTLINNAPLEDTTDSTTGKTKKQSWWQGLGIVREIRGLLTIDAQGGEQLATPSIHERSGAEPQKFVDVAEHFSRTIREGMGMGWIDLADSEYASGKSKQQSKSDYEILLLDYETTMNTVGTKLLQTVIRLAFNFTGESSKNRNFNVLFRTNVSTGNLTNDDKNTMMAEVKEGLRSDENYMLNAKVSDNPKLEKQRIAMQPAKQLEEKPTEKPATV